MLIDGPDDVYMIDRDNAVYKVPSMKFPCRKEPSANITETLLDGVRHYYNFINLCEFLITDCILVYCV